VASFTDLITGALAVLATVAGTVVTILLGRVHLASYRTQQLQNKLLRQQLISMGGDPDKDDE
jgi:FlaG/FlaF family flagellin (archaellin)